MTYYSPHAFKLVDRGRSGDLGPLPLAPEAGEATLPDDEARDLGRDYLRTELEGRLRDAPATFDLRLQIREDGDPLDDPTAVWPDERERVLAGRLEITEIVDDPESGEHIDVFDPPGFRTGSSCPTTRSSTRGQGLLRVGLPPPGGRGGEPVAAPRRIDGVALPASP